jgi:hypothetical protein
MGVHLFEGQYMHKFTKLLAAVLVIGVAGPASAIQYKFSGDFNNRLELYTDQAGLYSGSETIGTIAAPGARIQNGTVGETYWDVKYRLTADVSTDDKIVRGVYGIEVGAVRAGNRGAVGTTNNIGGGSGGAYSGDGINVETRFAYVDFQLVPNHRLSIGLQPWNVNKFLWNETAMAVALKGTIAPVGYTLGWARGKEFFNSTTRQQQFRDADSFLARADFVPMKDAKAGLFFVYQRSSPEGQLLTNDVGGRSHLLKNFAGVQYDLYNIGADAALKFGQAFMNADFIFQTGKSSLIAASSPVVEQDHQAWLAHADVGYNFGAARFTLTGWYVTGDDDATDGDIENFISTDVDFADSIILMEGGYTDDNYFTEAPYFLDKGAIFGKAAVDYKASPKLTVSGAVIYARSAEDFAVGTGATAGTETELGWEFDAAVSYKFNPNLELAWNAGYLLAGDAMDRFEVNKDGEADRNIFRTTARVRYMF